MESSDKKLKSESPEAQGTRRCLRQFSKSCFDRLAAFFMMVLAFPLFVAAAIAVKTSSKGPILFRQQRLTKDEREFTILKFRTMYVDFDRDARGIQIKASSLAITPIGRFLRRTKIDELPQLVNILLGEMSFVGPRPELPRRLKFYSPESRAVFKARSGITSPASILLADEERMMEAVADPEAFYICRLMPLKIELNKYYLSKQSFIFDVRLLVLTALRIMGFDCSKLVLDENARTSFLGSLTDIRHQNRHHEKRD